MIKGSASLTINGVLRNEYEALKAAPAVRLLLLYCLVEGDLGALL